MELHLSLLFAKIVIWSPLLQIFTLSFGTLVSFLVSYHQGDVTIYLPFISETGAIVPEMGIFSWTLICGSFFGVIVILYRFSIVFFLIPREDEKLKLLNKIAAIVGFISIAGLAGVAAFPMSTVLVVHLIAAGIHFALAVVYLFMQTYISFKTIQPYYSKYSSIIRAVLALFLLAFLLLLIILFPLSFFKWKSVYPDRPKASKTPEDEYFGLLFCAALFEWLFYITFLTFMFTFTKEFRMFVPEMLVRPVVTKEEKETIGTAI